MMFRITARTVLELGAELISSDIIAFYELIKNGFDAGSTSGVEVRFDIVMTRRAYADLQRRIAEGGTVAAHLRAIEKAIEPGASDGARQGFLETVAAADSTTSLAGLFTEAQAAYNTIAIIDRGSGMSIGDLEDNFLVIGTPSRKRAVDAALASGATSSPFLGEKGIGRLSAMRLGERLRVETARADDLTMSTLIIDWRAFGDVDAMLDQIPIEPSPGGPKPTDRWSGTAIIVSDLVENWPSTRVRELCETDFAKLADPFENGLNRPRIAVFWNGDRQPIPMMPPALLQAAHARITGRYEIVDGQPLLTTTVDVLDLGFDHPAESETVSLGAEDLQGVIVGDGSDVEDSALHTVGPFSFEAHWFNRRRLSRVDSIGEQMDVRHLQDKWSGVLMFRDHFRVFPYGREDDDWLELDKRALRRSGYTLNKTQFVGRVRIARAGNSGLVDQTNREGLRVTPEQRVLLKVLQWAFQDRLGGFMQAVERQYKKKRIDLTSTKTRVTELEAEAKSALRQIRRVTPAQDKAAVDQVQQTLLELAEFAHRARERIAEVERESHQMVEMAGVGLMVEVVAHELARASENALKTLDRLRRDEIPDNLRAHFSTLRAEMKSISKRVRILDPMSVAGRQRQESFSLDDLLRDTMEAHSAQFERHRVELLLDLPQRSVRVRAVKGMIVQILENLVSNSIYWMDMRAQRDPGYERRLTLTLEGGPPTITFEDNGRGIAPENADKVFRPFFSLKEAKRRRGLGLYIARDAADHHGGTLVLSDHLSPETGRLHRFILELPAGTQL